MKTLNAEYIPLFQTIVWVVLIVFILAINKTSFSRLITSLIVRLEKGSSVKLGSFELGEIKNQLNSVENEISSTNDLISRLFLSTMSPLMYKNLKKISTGTFGKYKKSKGLERELYHLRDIGYIEIDSITKIPQEGENLSDFVEITNAGIEFVSLRESIIKEKTKP